MKIFGILFALLCVLGIFSLLLSAAASVEHLIWSISNAPTAVQVFFGVLLLVSIGIVAWIFSAASSNSQRVDWD